MGRYLVIENEPKFQALILEAIKALDSQCVVETFGHFHDFQQKINHLPEEEKKTFMDFNLTLLGLSDWPYKDWKKVIDELKSLPRLDSAICLTGCENPALSVKFLQQLDIYNFIFKPFDPLILKETIYLSLQQNKIAQTHEIKSQKAAAFIGILKDVELQALSEMGFMTFSDSEIPKYSIGKYISHLFKSGKKQSVWAQCLLSSPHPQKPGFFINQFQFYGVDKNFLNQIRHHIVSFKQNETSSAIWGLMASSNRQNLKMAVIAEASAEMEKFCQDIAGHYTNLAVEIIQLDDKQKTAAYDHDFVLNMTALEFEKISSFFKAEALFFWMTASAPREDQFKNLAAVYREVFILPLDKSFFYKKLKSLIPDLNCIENPSIIQISCHEKIKAAQNVRITEINEIFVNLSYPRELDLKTFREFIFLNQDEALAIEIPAFCHFKEKNKQNQPGEDNFFFHQFVFFAMTDHFLKEIRLWLLHNHVLQNKKS